MTYTSLTHSLLTVVIGILSLGTLACLIRAILGPSTADRLIAVNMFGTLVNGVILVLSGLLDESWLVDVALIYTMISFVTVLILTRVTLQASAAKAQLSGNGTEGNSHE